jgi:hypothetical protein
MDVQFFEGISDELEPFRFSWNHETAPSFCFVAFSRENRLRGLAV